MTNLPEREVFAKTVYAEARGESEEGQTWVAWVIKNRAYMNRSYWGGNTIKGVCLFKNQFECWNNKDDIHIGEPEAYGKICELTDRIYDSSQDQDPTGRTDHYNNPAKEGYPSWVNNCTRVRTIGNHVFYKGP